MKHKKLWALLLAATMVAGTISGCGNSSSENASAPQDETESADSPAAETAGAEESGEETVKLTVGVVTNSFVEDYETNYLTQLLEQANNVELEFVGFPSNPDDATSKFSLMVSSNSELPDIICMDIFNDGMIYEYGSKGIFLPIEDYLADSNLAKNFNSIDDENRDFMLVNSKSPDGHIYGLTQYAPWAWNQGPYRMWYNKNWLETLNLPMPETIDDFYNVLKAFVNEDPNGNGINDEIGLVGAKDGWALDVIPFVMNAFIYTNPDKAYLNVVDGKIIPSYTQDEWKEGLEFLKKLADEGLLSLLSFTQDQDQLKALVQQEGGVAGFVPAGSYWSIFSPGAALGYDEMQLLPPLTGPDGVKYATYNPDIPGKVWFITKDCKNVEKALAVGDSFYSKELSMISRYGEKGVNWDDDPEQLALWANRFSEMEGFDIETTFYGLEGVWGDLQNTHWHDTNPKYRDETEMMGEGIYLKEEPPLVPDFNPDFFKYYKPVFPKEYITKLEYTAEETETIAVPSTDIINHVKEMSVAFITGNRSLDEWDDYLAELDAMGLENYIKITQDAYDRSK